MKMRGDKMVVKHIIRGNVALVLMSVLMGAVELTPWRGSLIMIVVGGGIYNLLFGYVAYIFSKGTYDTETDTLEWNDETN